MDTPDPIVYRCTGINEHGSPCNKTLFVFTPPAIEPIPGAGARRADLGVIEQKCRRCKTLNVFRMGDHGTVLRALQVGQTKVLQHHR